MKEKSRNSLIFLILTLWSWFCKTWYLLIHTPKYIPWYIPPDTYPLAVYIKMQQCILCVHFIIYYIDSFHFFIFISVVWNAGSTLLSEFLLLLLMLWKARNILQPENQLKFQAAIFQKKCTLSHIRLNIYIWKIKFSSHNQYLEGISLFLNKLNSFL